MADVEERVKEVIADVFGMDAADIGPETSPDTIESWDSLQHLTLILAIEEEFEIQMTDEETVSLVTLPLIVEIVGDHVGT